MGYPFLFKEVRFKVENTGSYLAHYGRKGMRWYQHIFGDNDPRAKYSNKMASPKTFDGQDRSRDIVIPKGSTIYRAQVGSKIAPNKDGIVYAVTNKKDHEKYMRSVNKTKISDAPVQSIKIKLDEDLKLPSYQKTMKTFLDSLVKSGGKDVYIKDIIAQQGGKDTDPVVQKFISSLSSSKKLTMDNQYKAYKAFSNLISFDTVARKIFIESLKRDGYNAVIDENDIRKTDSNSPIIIFDNAKIHREKG